MTALKDIVFETDHYWVKRVPKGFEVYKIRLTHSTRVAVIGYTGDKGLQRAKDEIARRVVASGPSKQHHSTKKSPAQLQREIDETLSQAPGMTTEQIGRYRSGRKWGWPADLAFKAATGRPLSRTPGHRSHAQKTTALKDIEPGLRNVAQRSVDAENRFIDYAMEHGRLSRGQAVTALAAFRKARVIKFDAVNGTFHVKHGQFLEPDVLRRAADVE